MPRIEATRFFVSAVLGSLLLFACAAPQKSPPETSSISRQQAEEALGIESVAIRQTSAGYMLDYRYKVVDPALAAVMLNRKNKPYLMHEASGKVLAVPVTAKVGPLRQSTLKPEAGRIYFMMFGNAGKLVRPGDRVTLIVGQHRIEHLTVE